MSGAAHVRPNPPPLYLGCEVRKDGKFVGNVICSADIEQLPFRKEDGYSVAVICTGGAPAIKLIVRVRNFNAIGKSTTNTGTGKKRSKGQMSEVPRDESDNRS